MIRTFLSLQWKEFKRSASFQKGIAIKILLIFAALYFGSFAILLGAFLFKILSEFFPEQDPITTANNYLIFWFLFDLVFRYFMQQMPVMNVKPLMIIPIKQKTIIHFLLGKTMVSFFNFLPLFIFIPFSIVLLVQGYSPVNVILWFLAIVAITYVLNFTNILANKSNTVFYIVLSVIAVLAGLEYLYINEYFDAFKVSEICGMVFNALYNYPFLVLIPIVLAAFLYYLNFDYLNKRFYLDDAISKKVKEVTTTDLSWMNRFGKLATFLKNDVRMIWRNKRPKQVLFMSGFFLFYGVIFFVQKQYNDMPGFLAFASIFVTAGFLFSFGQLVPSWDSEYYKMLMSQNIPYRKYLESKWYLMVLAVFISFLLSTPYIYFGWDKYAMIAAGASFNIGINSFVTLFGGALNRVPVKLNEKAKAFSNTQGFNPTQLLIALPKMLLPVIIFYIPYLIAGLNAGIISLALSGVVGLLFRNFFLKKIEQVYQKGKYKTIEAFGEN
ncbi:DUF5687 family protein [Kordia algicida OT-1]|uniref:Uncharacterized protein n=1 Tax=Kordia algicida OT-1 TaxID=391587 RepID=A9DSU0_9FLAO|nr:DUF5687 family protein [Kordia algicida]EDP96981.1 hypothetical protein KAOT1_17498 [Kordia algicida OT-1]